MKVTTSSDLSNLFSSLNISAGDNVMVHGFFPSLGVLQGGYSTFFDTLLQTVGNNGGIIIPTFTYSHCHNEVYDVVKTGSTIGAFTNFFIENYPCYRNLEPNFSMAALGGDAEKIINRDTDFVFGKQGIYQKIEDANVKFLLVGIGWDQGLSYSMHVEHTFGVDYRYDKEFFGTTIDHEGKEIQQRSVHYVRDLDRNAERYRTRLGIVLEEKGIAQKEKFRYGVHRTIFAQDFARMAHEKMRVNPYYMLKEIDGKEVNV